MATEFYHNAIIMYEGHLIHKLVQHIKPGARRRSVNFSITASTVSHVGPSLKIPQLIHQTAFVQSVDGKVGEDSSQYNCIGQGNF